MPTLNEFVRKSPWAALISPTDLAQVESTVVERQLKKDEFAYRRGDPPAQWIGVIEGELRMVSFSRNGKMTSLARVPADDWIGEASLIFLTQRRFDLVAKRTSRIACMPKETFSWLYGNSIPFNNYLVKKLAHRMGRLANMLAVDRLTGTTARVAYCLVNIAVRETPMTKDGWLKISQEELGFLAGLSRQHANRAVVTLAREGYVLLDRGRIAIKDLAALERLSSP